MCLDRKKMGNLGSGYIKKEETEQLLGELLDSEALEIQILTESGGRPDTIVRIPYMMNDAVEFYLEFQKCIVRGTWENEEPTVSFSLVENGDSDGLILRQKSGNIITIWYEELWKNAECYQYHRIGHKWRRASGEENIRRIVNLLCVIHDKVSYLDGDFCNKEEVELACLAEFGPLRFFSPINESILEWYPETQNGTEVMKKLAAEVEDFSFLRSLEKYEEDLKNGKVSERRIQTLAKEFLKPVHERLFRNIEEKITTASVRWKVRDYGQKRNEENEAYQKRIEKQYKELGYEGTYPYLKKKEGKSERMVEFVEEHPFTVLEYEDYVFRIFSMKTEAVQPYRVEMKEER